MRFTAGPYRHYHQYDALLTQEQTAQQVKMLAEAGVDFVKDDKVRSDGSAPPSLTSASPPVLEC